MKILIFNWRDVENPWAGGGEINIHEQAKRWVQWGHSVTMLVGGFPKGRPYERETVIDGKVLEKDALPLGIQSRGKDEQQRQRSKGEGAERRHRIYLGAQTCAWCLFLVVLPT